MNDVQSRDGRSPAATQTPSETVVYAVADAEGTSPLDLEPLATVIDPDELDRLLDSMGAYPNYPTGRVTFSYAGYSVTVSERGDVSLDELEA